MEESMEHCFFIEEQAIKVLFRNCPGSAKRLRPQARFGGQPSERRLLGRR